MNNQFSNRFKALRFRRFSRAAYAVFASLSREISIGKLAVSIANSADKKVSGAFADILASLKIQHEEEYEEFDAETQTIDMLLLQTQIVADKAAACDVMNRTTNSGG